jgi:hypothetical protein
VITARQPDEVICPYMLRRNLVIPAHLGPAVTGPYKPESPINEEGRPWAALSHSCPGSRLFLIVRAASARRLTALPTGL